MQKLLMSEYKTKDNNISFHLKFVDKLTLINGESGIGKTMLFKAIERDSLLKPTNIICLNFDDIPSGNIEYTLNTAKGKVIIIDNADVALDLLQRAKISLDNNNQYIIFTHSTDGFIPSAGSIAELVIEKGKGFLDYIMLRK